MPLPRPLRLVFKAAAGFTALSTGVVIGVNINNADFYADTASPLDFAAQNGANYSTKTKDYLRAFNDVRVVVATPEKLDRICKINFFVCGFDGHINQTAGFAYTPTKLERIWGLHPSIFMPGYTPNLMNDALRYMTGKMSDVMTEDHSRMIFDMTLIHEVGHFKSYRMRKPSEYLALPVQIKEREADRTTLTYMNYEYGPAGPEFVVHLRGLTQADYYHDNLLYLKPGMGDDFSDADSFETNSLLSWVKYMAAVEKCSGIDPRKGQMKAPVHDAFYRCVRDKKAIPTPQGTSEALFAERKKSYVQAYDYFFGPPASP